MDRAGEISNFRRDIKASTGCSYCEAEYITIKAREMLDRVIKDTVKSFESGQKFIVDDEIIQKESSYGLVLSLGDN